MKVLLNTGYFAIGLGLTIFGIGIGCVLSAKVVSA